MKKLFLFFLLTPLFTNAQDKALLVEGVSPNLYVNHKVEPKENYYSIGRIYNISPKDIAPFNNLQLENGLSLGQNLKIPLNSSNFFQSGNAATDEVFVPVYYKVKDKEGLYRVALNHNDLPLENLKQWNNIKGDVVKNGTKLIVGYLKVKKDQSALAKNGVGNSIDSKITAEIKPPANDTKEKTTEEAAKPVIKTEKEKTVVAEVVKNEPVKKVKEAETGDTKTTANPVRNGKGGAFKGLYESQTNNVAITKEEGTGAVFKSTSGWKDGKYYCLHNTAMPGTIIKVTNPANERSVYVKVLDLMPDIKQNNGLVILISNAAADELGVAENNFFSTMSYSK